MFFSGFFWSDFPKDWWKEWANSLWIDCKSLILRTPGCRSKKAIFSVFLAYLVKSSTLGNSKANFLPPLRPNKILDIWEQPVQISSKSYSTAAFGGLKWLRRFPLCYILCYPISYKQRKKQMTRLNADIPKNTNKSELEDWSKF